MLKRNGSKKTIAGQIEVLEHLHIKLKKHRSGHHYLKEIQAGFGGDGIFTIPLSGMANKQASQKDKVLFLFSDSMIGNIKDNAVLADAKMIHNSVAILDGSIADNNKINFYWANGEKEQPESVFIPATPKTEKGDYFWLGNGFVNQALNNNIYIFGYRIKDTGNEAFGFKEVGNVLIKIPANSKPPYMDQVQKDTPFT